MLVPFFGHIISGSLMIMNCVFTDWDARYREIHKTCLIKKDSSLVQPVDCKAFFNADQDGTP